MNALLTTYLSMLLLGLNVLAGLVVVYVTFNLLFDKFNHAGILIRLGICLVFSGHVGNIIFIVTGLITSVSVPSTFIDCGVALVVLWYAKVFGHVPPSRYVQRNWLF